MDINRVNVGTIGHIDHDKRTKAAPYVYGILFGNLAKCSCMTKTPNINYHNPTCAYRKSVEEYNEASQPATRERNR